MTPKKIQHIFFSFLVALSLLSSVYVNGEAKELKTQGFDVSYFSPEDDEKIFPDVQLISHLADKIKEIVFFK